MVRRLLVAGITAAGLCLGFAATASAAPTNAQGALSDSEPLVSGYAPATVHVLKDTSVTLDVNGLVNLGAVNA